MIRGNEILCSQSVMSEVFDEDEMVLLYRFSLEIEKAKNSLDLNLGPTVENGDHIVPTASRTWTMNRVAAPLGRMYAGNGFGKNKIRFDFFIDSIFTIIRLQLVTMVSNFFVLY